MTTRDQHPRPPEAEDQVVRFLLDGAIVEVANPAPTTTVLDYLRETLGRTGTKEGCAEGDCGACTVLVGELSQDGSAVNYSAVNSCIRFLPTLDGRELVTVESLAAADGSLHPAQQAMVDLHGSQCGFCTPGFVMSLTGLYLDCPDPTREQVLEAISGNLCRCTGYRPIIDAGLGMESYPAPTRFSREDAASTSRRTAIAALTRRSALRLPGFEAPRDLDDLAATFAARPNAIMLAGGTDLGLRVTKALATLPAIVYLGEVAALRTIEASASGLTIGAGVTLSEAWAAITRLYPAFAELAERFASPPVCHAGTLCGNLANGSPIGDAMPALLATGCTLNLRRGERRRSMALEDFYISYGQTALEPGEFIVSANIPAPESHWQFAGYKLGKRWDQDISAVCAGFAVKLRDGQIEEARVGFGGMAAIPSRAPATEAALSGAPLDDATLAAAVEALAEDFRPISDMRASCDYRLQAAGNLLRRFFHALHALREPDHAPLRVGEVR